MRRGGCTGRALWLFFLSRALPEIYRRSVLPNLPPPTRPSLLLNDEDVPLTPCSHFISLRNTLACPLGDRYKSATDPHTQTASIDIVLTFSQRTLISSNLRPELSGKTAQRTPPSGRRGLWTTSHVSISRLVDCQLMESSSSPRMVCLCLFIHFSFSLTDANGTFSINLSGTRQSLHRIPP